LSLKGVRPGQPCVLTVGHLADAADRRLFKDRPPAVLKSQTLRFHYGRIPTATDRYEHVWRRKKGGLPSRPRVVASTRDPGLGVLGVDICASPALSVTPSEHYTFNMPTDLEMGREVGNYLLDKLLRLIGLPGGNAYTPRRSGGLQPVGQPSGPIQPVVTKFNS